MNKMILKNLFSDNNIFRIIEKTISVLNIIISIEDCDGNLIFGEQDNNLLSETCEIIVGNNTVGIVKGNKDVSDIGYLINKLVQNELTKETLLNNIDTRNKIINILYRLPEIASQKPIDQSKYLLLEEIMNHFESNIIFVALIDKVTNELNIEFQLFKKFGKVLSENLSKNFIDIDNEVIKDVVNTRQGIIVNETEKDPRLNRMGALIESFVCVPMVYRGELKGIIVVANDSFLNYTLPDLKLLSAIAIQSGVYLQNLKFYRNVRNTFFDTIKIITKISEIRKNTIKKTNIRVIKFSVDIAKKMMLSEVEQGQVKLVAMICDIGEVGVSDEILNKETGFSRDELKKLKEHPVIASEIIEEIESLNNLVPIIRAHHERFDGVGYPDKLKGEQIPLIARIISVASEFDAMISKQNFNIDTDLDDVIEELKNNKETKFDPEIVDEFLRVLRDKSKEEIRNYINKDV